MYAQTPHVADVSLCERNVFALFAHTCTRKLLMSASNGADDDPNQGVTVRHSAACIRFHARDGAQTFPQFAHTNTRKTADAPELPRRWPKACREIGLNDGRSATRALFYARLRVHRRCADVPLCVRNVSAHFAHTNTRKAADDALKRRRRWPQACQEIGLNAGRLAAHAVLFARLCVPL